VPLVLAAPDKFRGTLSASEAAAAIASAAADAGWRCEMVPLSDGGEGFLEVFSAWGTRRTTQVTGPLGRPVLAEWLLGRDPVTGEVMAVVEAARANGLTLAGGPTGNDPVAASTTGVGQLVAAALGAGARQVLLGMGGSATTDGGLGAVEVLAGNGRPLVGEVLAACDVETRFLEAAAVFGPQKGASPAQVELLARRLERLSQLYRSRFGVDVRPLPGGGAAGGLGGGLAAIGARLVPGFDLVAERLALGERVAQADLVVTGEGFVDRQSFSGKVVGGVAHLCAAARVPLLVVAGHGEEGAEVPYVSLVERFGADESFGATAACLTRVVSEQLARAGS
jgi:glycerate 2-kinase